jgi:preprotein translocase subunit SecB
MLSLLRLDAVRLDRLVLRSRSDAPAATGEQAFNFTLTHREAPVRTSGAEHAIQLRVRLRPDTSADTPPAIDELDIVLTGYFTFADQASTEIKAKVYPLTAVAMLFGVARGIVAQTTGLFPTGTFMLPPLDITQAAKRKRLTGTCTLIASPARSDQRTAAIRTDPVGLK